jgi:Flp pilus assembly protein TadG
MSPMMAMAPLLVHNLEENAMKMLLKIRHRRKAQSLVEFALGGILLMMLLAASVDLGRAYYTYIVVQNMAGEGAAVLSLAPDADLDSPNPPANVNDTFQYRARNVAARVQGAVISPTNVRMSSSPRDVRLDPAVPFSQRCTGRVFSVIVDYHVTDLFFPAFLGFQQLTIGAESQSTFYADASGAVCPTPTFTGP